MLDSTQRLTAERVYSKDFDFVSVISKKNCSGQMASFRGRDVSFQCNIFSPLSEIYKRRADRIKLIENNKIGKTQNTIDELKNSQNILGYKRSKELLTEFGLDMVLSEGVRDNKLLSFMLRRGYLDEDYANYINYFKGTSITKSDMNFILAVKNLERTEFEYSIIKIPQVIQRLQPYEFRQKSIYNYALLEELLSSESESEKRDLFIEQLADEDECSWAFIVVFIVVTKRVDLL